MKYYDPHTILWLDGQFLPAAEARVDLYGQTMHYGYGVFEGIRAYGNTSGRAVIFKAREHYDRLHASASALRMPFDVPTDELIRITYELLERNQLTDAYIRPLLYAPANMSFQPNEASHLAIMCWPMSPFLGEKLIRIRTSSYQRPNPSAFHMHAKACGHYVNSLLASHEAKADGYDEALLLDQHGHVAEGPGANVFIEKDGRLYTPPPGHILAGITRQTVLELCHEHGIAVEEKSFTVEEMKRADSAFYCGTAAEVAGVASIDDTVFPKAWETTQGALLQRLYKQLVTHQPDPEPEFSTATHS